MATPHAIAFDLEIPYKVRVAGIKDTALINDLKAVSGAEALRGRPPHSLRQLQRRAERDTDRFQKVLRNRGFYAASVEVKIEEGKREAQVVFQVDTGPVYTLRTVRIAVEEPEGDDAESVAFLSPEAIGLVRGEPALARRVVHAEERIRELLEREGHPFPRIEKRTVRVEHAARAMDVHFKVRPGPVAVFGDTTFSGLSDAEESFVRAKLPWNPGDAFNGTLLRVGQRRLTGADLFTSVRMVRADELDDGMLPIRIEVSERRHRSITLGGGYGSDEGARGRVGWEHRNLLGRGERLSVLLNISELGYGGVTRLQKPDFLRLDQTFEVSLRSALEDTDAFRSRHVGVLFSVNRLLQPGWVAGVGTGFRYVSVREDRDEERFGLLYLPVHLDVDRSDDVLDPRRGWRLSLGGAPYRDMIDSEVAFLKTRASVTQYQRVIRRPEIGWAGRAMLGTISGVSRDAVPADERFYAGGGGSVRGYAYQSVGPLDGKNPIGGKSMAVVSSELRWRINQEFGLVAFIDGGSVYETSWPDNADDVLWGAGLGFRYFTPVGPLRVDVALPLDRRSEVDDSFQFYISLGQAF